jgi:hypothetical protein
VNNEISILSGMPEPMMARVQRVVADLDLGSSTLPLGNGTALYTCFEEWSTREVVAELLVSGSGRQKRRF